MVDITIIGMPRFIEAQTKLLALSEANFKVERHEDDLRQWICKLDIDIDFQALAKAREEPKDIEK